MPLEPWVAAAGDLLLGAGCHGCGAAWWGVCPACRARLGACRPHLTSPDPAPPHFPLTVTCAPYDDLLRGLLSAHKDRSALGLAPLLADRLAQSVHGLLSCCPPGAVLLVPVPSAGRAVRRRGYDATWVLARLAARQLAGRHRVRPARLLRQRPGLADQAGLGAVDRRRNLDGGLLLHRPQRLEVLARSGAGVVVVDDLVTTGSSLAESVRVLTGAGVRVLGAATVAATARRPARAGARPGPG